MNNVSGLLKAFVILGGIILVVGAILLAVMIAMRAGSGDGGDAPRRELALSGPVDLALPAGVRVGQVVVDGKRLVLLGEDPDGRQYIAVVDALSGARQSLIRLTPSE
ncbi:MAG: hypothetical protein AAF543_21645 [Pseudomonadota bacterium]